MKPDAEPIFVTKPFLPPLEELLPSLKQIWSSKILTNNGPFLQAFEKELSTYLNVPFATVVSSGSSALDIALKCLEITGEVITTPYSFVATAQSLLWNNLRPVFVDIDCDSCNLDAGKIEKSITKYTSAILPVHVYGYPCDVDQIKVIAEKYNLKVIYDAAHAFGVKYKGRSITEYGDLSILSFHATKSFNTFEGGAVICHDKEIKIRLDEIRDFGYGNEQEVQRLGVNAKMNEFQAALGILQLKYMDQIIFWLNKLHSFYLKNLEGLPGLKIFKPDSETEWNFSYFPVFIDESIYGASRNQIMERLKEIQVFCRRYFSPIIPSMNFFKEFINVNDNLQTAISKSAEVLCLPMYPNLKEADIKRIVQQIWRK